MNKFTALNRLNTNINSAVIRPKTPAAALPASKFYFTIMNPFASAKFAILHIKKNNVVTTPST